jgi:hypothetical protein
MKKNYGLLFMVLLSAFKISTTEGQETEVRQKILFNKGWKFILDDKPDFRNTDNGFLLAKTESPTRLEHRMQLH